MQNPFFYFMPFLPAISLALCWFLIKRQQAFWLIPGIIFWTSAHAAFFLMPDGGFAGDIGNKTGLTLGIAISIIYGGFILPSLYRRFGVIALLLWISIPLTLPASIFIRDVPITEQQGKCYIQRTGTEVDKFFQRNQQYPSNLDAEIFSSSLQPVELQNICNASIRPPWPSYNIAQTRLHYEQQGNTYELGGYYTYSLVDLVSFTRFCNYHQATKEVTCGFNNWAPFAPQ